jgi:acetyl-CoA acetyltransferase family protein
MGQHCEITTQELGIKREVQDQIAFRSHQRAAAAQKSGYLAAEIAPYAGVEHDNLVRADTSLEKLAKLAPVFDRSGKGTLTAGNSSALTDGASLVCLMSESEARRQGRDILGFIEGIHFAAIAPRDGLLMAPTVALPELLARHNLTVDQIDRFEIHEAFGAQVAANLEVWERGWSKYAGARVIGAIPEEKINVNGGSIAIGHPFAATGGRLVLSLARELKRTNLNTGVISVCAAGAMAGAVLIRRA